MAWGSGSITELPRAANGDRRWKLRTYVGRDERGRPQQACRVVRGTEQAARRELRKMVNQRDEGTLIAGAAGHTVGQLVDQWLNTYVARKARSTRESYAVHTEKHIKPRLGSIRLDKVTAYDLDRYFHDLEGDGMKPATVRLDHAILRSALSQGVRWGWLRTNPAAQVTLPEHRRSEKQGLSIDQVAALVRQAREDDLDLAAFVCLAVLTGCRRGELLGLKWSDVDWNVGRLRLGRQIIPGNGGQYVQDRLKNGGTRIVPLGTAGVELLEGYSAAKAEQLGYPVREDGWLLSYDGGTTPLRAKAVTEAVRKLGMKCGIPVNPHAFRAFLATEAHAAGIDLPTVSALTGDTPEVLTGHYMRTSPDRLDAAANVIGERMAAALAAPPNLK